MATVTRSVLVIIEALGITFPLFLLFAIGISSWKATRRMRFHALRMLSVAGVFGLVDLLLMKLLPVLQLSNGPILFPIVLWWSVRYGLFVSWAALSRRQAIRQSQIFHSKKLSTTFLVLNISMTIILLNGFFVEPFILTVSHVEVGDPNNGDTNSLRVVHLSDLHLSQTTRLEASLLTMVNEQQPDVIVMTGDYLNTSNLDDPVSIQQVRDLLGQLHAPLGVYAVNGNVDSSDRMSLLFDGLEIRVLDNEIVRLPLEDRDVQIVGISHRTREQDIEALKTLMPQVADGAYSILIYHKPDIIEDAAQENVDLYLAGHTHGGQIRLPLYGAIFTFSYYGKRFDMGQYQLGEMDIFITRGIGMEGAYAPRMRLLCPPEVVVIDIYQ